MCHWLGQGEGRWAKSCVLCVLAKLVPETGRPESPSQLFLEITYLKVTLWHRCNILPRKKASLPNCQTLKPIIGINKLEIGPGPFPPTAAFTENVYTFLCSKGHFHFFLFSRGRQLSFASSYTTCPWHFTTSCQTQNSWNKVPLCWCEWCSWSCFPSCSKAAMDSMGTKGIFEKLSVFQLCLPNKSFHAFCFLFFQVQVFTYSHCYHLFLLLLALAWEWRECCWTEQGNENSSIYLAALWLSFPSKAGCFLTCSSLFLAQACGFGGIYSKCFY